MTTTSIAEVSIIDGKTLPVHRLPGPLLFDGSAARRIPRAADIAPAIAAGIASFTTNLIEIPVSAA